MGVLIEAQTLAAELEHLPIVSGFMLLGSCCDAIELPDAPPAWGAPVT